MTTCGHRYCSGCVKRAVPNYDVAVLGEAFQCPVCHAGGKLADIQAASIWCSRCHTAPLESNTEMIARWTVKACYHAFCMDCMKASSGEEGCQPETWLHCAAAGCSTHYQVGTGGTQSWNVPSGGSNPIAQVCRNLMGKQ